MNLYSDSGLWNDENCGASNYFICEKDYGSAAATVPPTRPQAGNCPAGFTDYGNNCYLSSEKVALSWDEARQWCQSKGAELVSITNDYEQVFYFVHL